MRTLVLIAIFLLSALKVAGQDGGLIFKSIPNRPISVPNPNIDFASYYLDLPPLTVTNYKTHIRLALGSQIIDVYSLDDRTYCGELTNYITEYRKTAGKDDNRSSEYGILHEKVELDAEKALNIVRYFEQSKFIEVPTDSLISSWGGQFCNCTTVAFEYNINGHYIRQRFRCPWGQRDSIKYRDAVIAANEYVNSTLTLDTLYRLFERKLPGGRTYSSDGLTMMYVLTAEQRAAFKKSQPIRDYMKSIKDTVNSYLEAELRKQNIKLNGINCFDDFRLIIGRDGKLRKVYLDKDRVPTRKKSGSYSDYLADKREIKKCKKKIEEAFRHIDLAFIKLRYEQHRTLSFDMNGEAQLRDNNIY